MTIPKFATFSIVARDEKTGEIGIAGTTHWFAYGRNVPYIAAGVGAIATQAATNPIYGSKGIEALQQGKSAEQTVEKILNNNPDTEGIFQVILIDKNGQTAGHTGKNTTYYANHLLENNVAFAGNFLANEDVLHSMQSYYKSSKESFALKLIKTLQKGQDAGGDIRGKRSSALKITTAKTTLFDLRIDDNDDPLHEMERQYSVAQSFNFLNLVDNAKTFKEKTAFFEQALEVYPENSEALFWFALTCWNNGEKEKAKELKQQLIKTYGDTWELLWRRVVDKNHH